METRSVLGIQPAQGHAGAVHRLGKVFARAGCAAAPSSERGMPPRVRSAIGVSLSPNRFRVPASGFRTCAGAKKGRRRNSSGGSQPVAVLPRRRRSCWTVRA
ncbi:MAG: hypothetical protein HC767_04900 [Akkermansiaceae bacterium]|nr:hypothetical protein [Akkermansiaceae bacterium]